MENIGGGLSTAIRKIARKLHVAPAIRAGKLEFSISVRDLLVEAEAEGISTKQRIPPFCTAIQKDEFLEANGLEISHVDGPPSGLSTRVVVHYRVIDPSKLQAESAVAETAQERATRLTTKLRGLLREEMAAYGGGEAFLRCIRSEDDPA